MGMFGLPSFDIGKKVFGGGTMGAIMDGLFGSLLDPANVSGMFGHNVGPGAFMDPKGSGGGLFPGQSLGGGGVFGKWSPEGMVGVNPSSANKVGSALNTIGGLVAGGFGSGLLGGGGSGASGGMFESGSMPMDKGTGAFSMGMPPSDTVNMSSTTPAAPTAASPASPMALPAFQGGNSKIGGIVGGGVSGAEAGSMFGPWGAAAGGVLGAGLGALGGGGKPAEPAPMLPRTPAPPAFSLAPPPMASGPPALSKVGSPGIGGPSMPSSEPDMSSLIQALLKMKGMNASA